MGVSYEHEDAGFQPPLHLFSKTFAALCLSIDFTGAL
jgi:hypothetical protein